MIEDPTTPTSSNPPIVLFDGVCNLCDSAVQFVIDRDRRAQFRFAAMQSDAARVALDRAGASESLPDSMIVIDDRGVHTRSDAALAVARRLGFPWSLLTIAQLVPRFVRDTLYAWIARNRYLWFGRQTACRIPTPELRCRFLDADEVPQVVSSDVLICDRHLEKPALGLGFGTLPQRFLLIYPILFMLPFPLTLLRLLDIIPGYGDSFLAAAVNWMIELHQQAMQPIVAWMGRVLVGETPSFDFTGSGDGLASYLEVLLNLCIASLIAFAWWFWRRSTPVSPRVTDAYRMVLRYYVAYVMLSYGFSKVFPLQFSVMGPDRLIQPYGDSSPMGLLWTFMGASPGYQMFAGAAEVLGGLLLMFRRTALLGALVVMAVMANVFAMNLFFDVPVKLYSFHYLAFAFLVALPDMPRLVGLFVANVAIAPRDFRPFWFTSRRWCRIMSIAKVILIVALLGSNTDARIKRMRSSGPWAPKNDLRSVYRVESFEILGTPPDTVSVTDSVRWVRVGLKPPWAATILRADGTAVRLRMRLDEKASTMALFDRQFLDPPSEPLQLERLAHETIRLTGIFDDMPIEVTMRREEDESLFHSRGFRWISEYPFNR